MAGPVPQVSNPELLAAVQSTLDAFLAEQAAILARISPDLATVAPALSGMLAGGKRLRPAFCTWGYLAAGGQDVERILRAASSLELLQACALIHDDYMDRSDLRRGQPAIHRQFEQLHRSSGFLGDPAQFGAGAAILLGDLCLGWADELLQESGFDAEALARGRIVFDRMRTELVCGQYLDLLEQARGGGSVERALLVTRFKTAKYTIERPLHLGAALAGAGPDLVDALSGYGLPLGEAFQLRDDLLGVFGDPAATGKPAGDDLREGKRTLLVATALQRATPAQGAALRAGLGDPELSSEAVAELCDVMVDTGAPAAVEQVIAERLAQALAALGEATMPDVARQALEELAIAATDRRI